MKCNIKIVQDLPCEFSEPEEPTLPTILKRDQGQVVIAMSPVVNRNGPITAYRVVVVNDGGHSALRKDMLKSFQEAQSEGLPYYIAAELDPQVR
jgi:hypothetical protein